MPISRTSTSTSSGASRIVTGRPCSLLKLRSLAATRRPAPTAAAMKSLVVVLPTLPVMPTTVAGSCAGPGGQVEQRPAVSATLTVGRLRRPVARRTSRRPRRGGGGDEVVTVALGHDRHEELARPTQRESNDAPATSTSGPTSSPPVAAATSDARNLTAPNGTVDSVPCERIHLIVLFGGRSAEHEVSCVTATHVLGAIDLDRTG